MAVAVSLEDFGEHGFEAGKLQLHIDMMGGEDMIDQGGDRGGQPIGGVQGGNLGSLVDFLEQDRRVDADTAARDDERNGAATAEIDTVLFEDADGGGKSGGDLSDGAFRCGCGHDSMWWAGAVSR